LNFTLPDFNLEFPDLTGIDIGNVEFDITNLDLSALVETVAAIIQVPAEALLGIMWEITQEFVQNNLLLFLTPYPDWDLILAEFSEFITSPAVQERISAELALVVDESQVQAELIAAVQTFLQSAMQAYLMQVLGTIQSQVQTLLGQALETQLRGIFETVMHNVAYQMGYEISTQLEAGLGTVMTQMERAIQTALADVGDQFADLDVATLEETFQVNMDEEMIMGIMTAVMNPIEQSFSRNLSILGYADLNDPVQINIFPRSFEAKQEITAILDDYNYRMEAAGTPEFVIRYTDLIGVMMASVTSIIDMVTAGLVAFVAISLVVSSIMIGVITYISVLERKKEIGILRAIGASKGNIRSVFNAETLLVGFVAGVLGIAVTLIAVVIGNAIVEARFDVHRIAQLPATAAFALIGVSMLLTFVAGLIPSSAAARRDPVAALRSE
jgi:hypothetical protein